jgi:hypothetical protein
VAERNDTHPDRSWRRFGDSLNARPAPPADRIEFQSFLSESSSPPELSPERTLEKKFRVKTHTLWVWIDATLSAFIA